MVNSYETKRVGYIISFLDNESVAHYLHYKRCDRQHTIWIPTLTLHEDDFIYEPLENLSILIDNTPIPNYVCNKPGIADCIIQKVTIEKKVTTTFEDI